MKTTFAAAALISATAFGNAAQAYNDERAAFFQHLREQCGASFEGTSAFPRDPGDAFAGKKLVATIASCSDNEIRVPFAVGEDRSRTWIITKTGNELQLKHDHRHADGTPDAQTMYGGMATKAGSVMQQSFPADAYTARLIPAAATNVWTLHLAEDGQAMTYYLERDGKPRFKAQLNRRK